MRDYYMVCSVVLTKEENLVVATDVHTGIASQGNTNEEALVNLKEALELYYEDIPEAERVTTPAMFTTLEVSV